MSITQKKKTIEEYFKKISTLPKSTQADKKLAIANFKKFVSEKHNLNPEQLSSELLILKKQDEEQFVDTLYDILQDWINWNIQNGLGSRTLTTRFSNLRHFLYFLGVKTDLQDIKNLLTFPKKIKEERYPLTYKDLRALIDVFPRNPMRQTLYLACSSSGMRIGEAVQIRKSDLELKDRIQINIKAEYTKTQAARSTFVSKETEIKLMSYLDKLDNNDHVFTKTKAKTPTMIEIQRLNYAVEKIGMNKKYTSNNFHKITSHSFRSYFFTHAARKHGENYAHKLTGHGGYLMQYDRMTDEEKLKMYIELEEDLVVYDQTKNELKIQRLQQEKESEIQNLKDEMKKLKTELAQQDRRILKRLVKENKIILD